ncbi:DUF2971 domain-containing protein [Aestuariibius sp. HNIBRBA575]|uniref:DUF2971 domain-containing protein n=1 Tax=Aestuariibius sp. HNIBRBA575 TaxID=3233343 RepID=UPI0034A4213C
MVDDVRKPPSKLFRYRSNETEYFWDDLDKAIFERRFFMTPATIQNDPFESSPSIVEVDPVRLQEILIDIHGSSPIIPKKIIEERIGREISGRVYRSEFKHFSAHNFELVEEYSRQATKSYRSLAKRVQIACLSEAHDSILMWGLYSNSHKGICICFDVAMQEHVIGEGLVSAVEYCSNRPSLSVEELLSDKVGPDDAKIMQQGERLFLQKSADWAHEKEWRLFGASKDEAKGEYLKSSSLVPSGLIFGCRAEQQQVDEAFERYGDLIPLYKCELSSNSFELRFRELDAR